MSAQLYKPNKTQEQRILELLRERGQSGAYVYEFMTPRPNGLGISQYNSRIYGLREKGYKIVNKQPGHFVLEESEPEQIYLV
jgi:hypothetical protein